MALRIVPFIIALAAISGAVLLYSCSREVPGKAAGEAPAEAPTPKVPEAVPPIPKVKIRTEDGDVVVGSPGGESKALVCARAGCGREGMTTKPLVVEGKKLFFCSSQCLEAYRKAAGGKGSTR